MDAHKGEYPLVPEPEELVDGVTAALEVAQVGEGDRRGPPYELVPMLVDDVMPEVMLVVAHTCARLICELSWTDVSATRLGQSERGRTEPVRQNGAQETAFLGQRR